MRIEINSGGLQGNAIVDEMKADVSEMITSSMRLENVFGQLSQSIYGVTGGVGNLQTALNDIDARRRTEEQRGQTLRSASDAVEEFINNTRNTDSQVAGEMGGHQVEDYDKNGWNSAKSTVSGIGGEWAQKGLEYAAQAAAAAQAEKPGNATHAIKGKSQPDPKIEARNSIIALRNVLDGKQKRCDQKYKDAVNSAVRNASGLKTGITNKMKEISQNGFLQIYGGSSDENKEVLNYYANKIIYDQCVSKLTGADFRKADGNKEFVSECVQFDKIEEDFYIDGKKYHLTLRITSSARSASFITGEIKGNGDSWSVMSGTVNLRSFARSMESAKAYAYEVAAKGYMDMLNEISGWSNKVGYTLKEMGANEYQQQIGNKIDEMISDKALGYITDPDKQLGANMEKELLKIKDDLSDIKNCYGNLAKTSQFSAKCFSVMLGDEELSKQIFGVEYGGFLDLEEHINYERSDWLSKVEVALSRADADTCKKIQDALDWTNKRIDELGGPNGVAEAWDKAHESSWFNWSGNSVLNELSLIYGK